MLSTMDSVDGSHQELVQRPERDVVVHCLRFDQPAACALRADWCLRAEHAVPGYFTRQVTWIVLVLALA